MSEQQILQDGLPFGRYRLMAKLAVGGMAELFIARQKGVGGFSKTVVIKCILPYLAQDQDFTTMFLSEARLAAHLNHPNIVQIFDIGSIDGVYYMAMEYIAGQNLREVTRKLYRVLGDETPPPFSWLAAIFSQAAAGLDYIHKATDENNNPIHLVHRDISPNNIVVSYEGQIKIVDFGVAKARDQERETEVGVLKGRLSYMSPEQVSGFPLDGRSDIFSLGVVLYELTTNRRLFRRKSEPETIQALLHGPIPSPTHFYKNYPPALEAILMKMLQRNPEDRYQTAAEVQQAFHTFLASQQAFLGPLDIAKQMTELFAEEKQQALSGKFEQPVTTNDLLNLSRGSYRVLADSSLPHAFSATPPIPTDYVGTTPSHSPSYGTDIRTGSFHPGVSPPPLPGQIALHVSPESSGTGPQGPSITGAYESPKHTAPSPFWQGASSSSVSRPSLQQVRSPSEPDPNISPTVPPISPVSVVATAVSVSVSNEPALLPNHESEDVATEIVSPDHFAVDPGLSVHGVAGPYPSALVASESPIGYAVSFASSEASHLRESSLLPNLVTQKEPIASDVEARSPRSRGWVWLFVFFLLVAGGVGGSIAMGLFRWQQGNQPERSVIAQRSLPLPEERDAGTQNPSVLPDLSNKTDSVKKTDSAHHPANTANHTRVEGKTDIPLHPEPVNRNAENKAGTAKPSDTRENTGATKQQKTDKKTNATNHADNPKGKPVRKRRRQTVASKTWVTRKHEPVRKRKTSSSSSVVLPFAPRDLEKKLQVQVYQKEDDQRVYTSEHPKLCRKIEREVSRLLGKKYRVVGVTSAWQKYVRQRFAKSRKTRYVFYPRAAAYVIYSQMLRGDSYQEVAQTLVRYQKTYRFSRYQDR